MTPQDKKEYIMQLLKRHKINHKKTDLNFVLSFLEQNMKSLENRPMTQSKPSLTYIGDSKRHSHDTKLMQNYMVSP